MFTTKQEFINAIIDNKEIHYRKECKIIRNKLNEKDVIKLLEIDADLIYQNDFLVFIMSSVDLSIELLDSILTKLIEYLEDKRCLTIATFVSSVFSMTAKKQYISKELYEKYKNHFNFIDSKYGKMILYSQNEKCNLDIIDELSDNSYIDWYSLSFNKNLTDDFKYKYIDKLNIGALVLNGTLDIQKLTNEQYNEAIYYIEMYNKMDKDEYVYKQNLFAREMLLGYRNKFSYKQIDPLMNITTDSDDNKNFIIKQYTLHDTFIKSYIDEFNKDGLKMILKYQVHLSESVRDMIKEKIKNFK